MDVRNDHIFEQGITLAQTTTRNAWTFVWINMGLIFNKLANTNMLNAYTLSNVILCTKQMPFTIPNTSAKKLIITCLPVTFVVYLFVNRGGNSPVEALDSIK